MRDAVMQLLLLSLWGGAAALGALAVSAVLRRAHTPSRWLCWLWLAVGVRFALPWGIPLTLPRPQNQHLAQAADTVQALAEPMAPLPAPTVTAAPVQQPAPVPWYQTLTVWHLLAAVWALGVLVLAVRAVAGYARLRRTVALACKTPDGCYSGACVPAPFTLGILRPRIYLPAGLTGAARQSVLLHERTHLRRRDPLVKPLYYAVVCLHWFNPLAWLAFRQLEREMEAACDEAAVRGCDAAARNAYCESILQYALQSRMTPGSLAFGQGSVKQRIVHLLHYRRLGAGALLVCALAVGVSVTACMMQPQVAESTPETAAEPAAAEGPAAEQPPAAPENAVTFTPNTAGLPNLDDPANSPRFLCPVDYTYISRYMVAGGHRGDDLCAPAGTPVYAAQDGVVEAADFHWSYGYFVQLDHGAAADGRRWGTLYGHMRELAVEPGQTVKAGDLLGYVGSTGNATGNALHFEAMVDGVLAEPRYFTGYGEGNDSELTEDVAAQLRADCDSHKAATVAFTPNTAGLPNLDDPANSALLQSPLQEYKYISTTMSYGHRGIDLTADAGTPVYAAQDGAVTVAEYNSVFGNWVGIDHGAGADGHRWNTVYAHLDDLTVQAGQVVKAGDLIGHVGSTGNSTGNHLHFEVMIDGVLIDPSVVTGAPLSSNTVLTVEQAEELKAKIAVQQSLDQIQPEALQRQAVELQAQIEELKAQSEAEQQQRDALQADRDRLTAAGEEAQAAQIEEQVAELERQIADLERQSALVEETQETVNQQLSQLQNG